MATARNKFYQFRNSTLINTFQVRIGALLARIVVLATLGTSLAQGICAAPSCATPTLAQCRIAAALSLMLVQAPNPIPATASNQPNRIAKPTTSKPAKHKAIGAKKAPKPPQLSTGQPLTALAAVQRAEAFIIANGYTDVAVTDPQQLTPEALDKLISVEQRLKLRSNSLVKTAYGYSRRLPNGQPGWAVIFRRQPTAQGEFEPDQGRAVVMQLDGQNIRMFFQDVPLDSVEAQIKAPLD